MTDSLRNAMLRIGQSISPADSLAIPGGLHSTPASLLDLMKATQDPQVSRWRKTSEESINNQDFTEENQGVTSDGRDWFFSSNKESRRGIYRFSNAMQEQDFFGINFTGHEHIGDIDFYKGRIYAAMEQPAGILWLNTSFSSHGRDTLKARNGTTPSPQGNSLPWCAVNPWNGWLYSSKFGDSDKPAIDQVFAYNPADNFRHVSTLNLSKGLKRIQGGCFTANGHLLLASDHTHDIQCFSALNGHFRGRASIQVNTFDGEEVEGITVRFGVRRNGVESEVHVVLLDNDITSRDDIFFKHYSVPEPSSL